MKKIIVLGFIVNLISCSEKQETFERKENKEEEKFSILKIQTHESIEIDSSGIVAVSYTHLDVYKRQIV